MTWVCSRYNARSDWLILGYHSSVMPTGRLRACKSQQRYIRHINLKKLGVAVHVHVKPPIKLRQFVGLCAL